MLIREPEEIPLNDDEDLVEPVMGFFALGDGTLKVTCGEGQVVTLTNLKDCTAMPLTVKRFWKTGTTVKVYKWKEQ